MELVEINESNWLEAASLKVSEQQKSFVASPIGILARGYIYRDCRAKVFAIKVQKQIVGLAMVRDLDEEPVCYDLQQFMIDSRFQQKGYGFQALQEILNLLSQERKYSCVEVCVKMADLPAIKLYKKVGFVDTGYIDEDVPDSYNLVYRFQ